MSLLDDFEELVKLPDHTDLLAQPERFFQCGSRWFAEKYPDVIQIKDSTDWDFYCVDTPGNHKFLSNLGFKLVDGLNAKYPFDDLAVAIYTGADVQVIVRSDPAHYAKTILRISPEFYRDFLWKSGPNKPERSQIQRIFNQLFAMSK